jgi:2'-5' RNA ligase
VTGGLSTARCFVAVPAPSPLAEQLQSLDRPGRPGLRWTTPDQWHVTLCFLGSVDPARLLACLPASFPGPVRAVAGPRPFALSRHVWVLPVAGLDPLAAAVQSCLSDLVAPPERPFHGHLTLARGRRPGALAGLPSTGVGYEWDVQSVVAFRSELHPQGARYHELGRWPVTPV